MKFKIQKVHANMNGYKQFMYRVVIEAVRKTERYQQFHRVRCWCWDTYGPSSEQHTIWTWEAVPPWSWRLDPRDNECVLYLRSSAELAFFQLKFSGVA